jgi:hypothetical protein
LFSLKDFNSIGEYEAIKSVVSKLVQEGILISVYSGIYQKPNYSEFLKANVVASPRKRRLCGDGRNDVRSISNIR